MSTPNHYEALGLFVQEFAKTEEFLIVSLRELAKIEPRIAKALFSGVRADAAIQHMSRILEVRGEIQASVKEDFRATFTHFGHINAARNLMLHHPVTHREGVGFVSSNQQIALTKSREKTHIVSDQILRNMIDDLVKIQAHLLVDQKNSQNAPTRARWEKQIDFEFLQPLLQRPWLYKPPQLSSPGERRSPSSPEPRPQQKSSPK